MKLSKIYKEIITEAGGLSYAVKLWGEVIIDVLGKTEKDHLILKGKKYPEIYNEFPVDIFDIKIKYGGGHYDEHKSGYNDKGEYVVYLTLPRKSLFVSDYNPKGIINHELRHAYEDYQRMSTGAAPLSQSRESKLFYTKDFERLLNGEIAGNFNPFRDLFMALYLTSKLEQGAYAETIITKMGDKIIQSLKQIVSGSYFEKSLLSNDKLMQERWDDLKKKVDIPILEKFDDYFAFFAWADKTVKRRAEKVLKKLNKVKYLHQQGNDED